MANGVKNLPTNSGDVSSILSQEDPRGETESHPSMPVSGKSHGEKQSFGGCTVHGVVRESDMT